MESGKRYEVEIQLGKTDEAHVIRTIEYWDIERKRYPQYEYAAVIVAEDITSRFLNVIGLFNGFIPLVAIQIHAFRLGDSVSLAFTKVLDEMPLGLVDEDEEVKAATDRTYWEKRATKHTLAMVDEAFSWLRDIDPALELKYNKFYIGLARAGRPDNFVAFRPKKDWIWLEVRLDRDDEAQAKLDEAGLEAKYDTRWGRYNIRLTKADLPKQRDLLVSLMQQAHGSSE